MPALTRKRVNDRPETWHVRCAGVRVGVIVERSGAPPSSDQWQWICGFYPGIPATIDTALRRRLKRPARRSKRLGGIIYQSAPKLTSKNGVMMLRGTRRNMSAGLVARDGIGPIGSSPDPGFRQWPKFDLPQAETESAWIQYLSA
jgi:hypothetical protein